MIDLYSCQPIFLPVRQQDMAGIQFAPLGMFRSTGVAGVFRLRTLLLAALVCASGPSGLSAAELPFWADPQAMFEKLLGPEGEADEQLLAEIEVSAGEERRIGKELVDAYLSELRRQGLGISSRGRDVAYLRQLVAKLHPRMEQRERYPAIEVWLAQSDRCDARSFPGGHLVFFRGLLESAGSEAALIGIVGHELSHLDRGHHTRRIQQFKLTEQTFSGRGGVMPRDQFFATGMVMMRAWMRPFRIEYERQADLDGARWSYQAGYDCREMAQLFLRLHHRGDLVDLPVPEFLRSHPPATERHQAILQQYHRLQAEMPRDDLIIGQDSLRRRAIQQR
jgi:predicted Zn-dependent protease